MTMATIFRTASFRLWQKLTRALPLGPILPNIIPGLKIKTHTKQPDKSVNHTPTAMLSTNCWERCPLVCQCSPRGSTTHFELNYAKMWVFQDFNYAITCIHAFAPCMLLCESVCAVSMWGRSPIVAEKITIPSTFMPSLVPGDVFMMTSGGGVRSREKFWTSVPLSSWMP